MHAINVLTNAAYLVSSSGATALSRAAFGPGTGRVLLDDVECIGTESSIADCRNSGWGHTNCDHSEDASVVCQESKTS